MKDFVEFSSCERMHDENMVAHVSSTNIRTYSLDSVKWKLVFTVLGKKGTLKKPHESTSLPSIQKIFFLETFYISPKLTKTF